MKRLVSVVMCVAMMLIASAAGAFDAPGGAQYGVTTDGVYFVNTDLVKAANGSAPKLLAAPTFKAEAMKLDGNYYIYVSEKKFRAGTKTDFCFDVGNNQFIPHVLINDARIKAEDAADNGVGGYNFRMAPK